ncbi:MAG TPA: hypothetical protein VK781_09335 [Solirubrobacteraceae bacterium]|jgi:hypothetical protein|nr:hypothetical protein [Solirubrobacteraceae bacterium]
MSDSFDPPLPSDIRLLLRADAEQFWLHREVIPVLRQVEEPEELPEEEVGAALAYLEAMWGEATVRAKETDAAHSRLYSREGELDTLAGPANRYHTAVRELRGIVAERVSPFVDDPSLAPDQHSEMSDGVRVKDTRGDALQPGAGGCTPRAA